MHLYCAAVWRETCEKVHAKINVFQKNTLPNTTKLTRNSDLVLVSDPVLEAPSAPPEQPILMEDKKEEPDGDKEPAAALAESEAMEMETEVKPEGEVKVEAEKKPEEVAPKEDENEDKGIVPSDQPKEPSEEAVPAVAAPPAPPVAPPALTVPPAPPVPPPVAEEDASDKDEAPEEPMEVTESEAIPVQETVETSILETMTTTTEEEERTLEQESMQEEAASMVEDVMMEVESKENISDDVTVSSQDSGDKTDTEKLEPSGDCYCGEGRNYEDVELQCNQCFKWFHKACITTVNVVNTLPYMTTYTFCCKNCNVSKLETFSRKVANFKELCQCALANLQAQHKTQDPPKTMFSKETDLIPFIDTHWEQLTPMPRRTTITWHGTIVKAMMKDDDVFVCKEKPDDPEASDAEFPIFGLLDQDLSKITPNSESKLGSSLKLDSSQKLSSSLSSSLNGNSNLVSSQRISRSAKRKGFDSNQGVTSSKRTRSELPASQKLPAHGYPLEHPFNKDGYRYVLTESDPHAPSSAFEEDQWIGKPIPAHLYRMALSKDVLLALHDRAPQLKISEDRLLVTGDRGYCMTRATHGISRGSWYFEVMIDQMPEGSATRLGWSQPLGNLQAPLGYDKFSYSWRSRKGTKFHESRGKRYSEGYGEGDTLGFFIQLPEKTEKDPIIPPTYKDRALIKFKSHLYFEEKDQTSEAEKALVPTTGTKIIFFKNGQSQGVAYEDVYEGAYHPAVSLYKQSIVTVNFGPDFKYPPISLQDYRPISDLAYLSAVEQTISDILFIVEHEKDYELAARGVLIDI
ncbi:set1/Ash2 histone methyltransferase complex subunit ASH2 isoform X1 [Strongylocentrotus purpuratus]|uniref:B30.2/SPRY domain-containing protein n=1 Tax=Strongylocentrotus purpuratus TaxID=7668 RepID=A0A7M7NDG0_STRPU|nr:set1/Ash2 histone methyltransferase complex subunit ASH2 isoform X1 [Strongylocentrotus purpuratus]